MKRLKALLCIVLCLAVVLPLLSACKPGDDGTPEMTNIVYGRYVEEDISPEGMKGYPQNFIAFGDGNLDIITVDWGTEETNYKQTYLRWHSSDSGKTWQQMDMGWTEEYINDYSEYYEKGIQPPEEVYLSSITPCSNGDTIFQLYTYTWDEATQFGTSTSELYRLKADGTKEPFEISGFAEAEEEGYSASLNQIKPLPGDRMFINYYKEPQSEELRNDPNLDWSTLEVRAVYDMTTGEKLYDLDFNGWDVIYNNNTLFLNDWERGFVAVNITDGSPYTGPLPSQELLARLSQGYGGGSSFVDDENNFYSVNARGVEKFTSESEEAESVMDGLNYTYGSPLYGINGMMYDPESEAIIMAVYDTMNYEVPTGKLLRYVWDDEAIASSDLKIRVYSLYDNYSVRLGLSEFKRQHPEVTIEYETAFEPQNEIGMMPRAYEEGGDGSSDSNAKTEEDALRALNTELLNGEGPDVLILDGLPVESFTEKGVLEDLTELVQADENLLKPILEPLYKDGKIYSVPTNLYIPTLMGEAGYVEQFTSLGQLITAIQEGPDKPGQEEYNENWTFEEQEAYYQRMYGAKKAEEQPVLYVESLEDLFTTFYATSAPSIFTEKGGIDKDKLAQFLQDVKAVSDKYELVSPDGEMAYYGGGYSTMSMGGYASWEIGQTMSRFSERQSRLGYARLGSYQILQSVSWSLHYSGNPQIYAKAEPVADIAIEGEEVVDDVDADVDAPDVDASTPAEDTSDGAVSTLPGTLPGGGEDGAAAESEKLPKIKPATIVMPGLAEGTYFPVQMVGVTTTSKQPEMARAFVTAMLSDEVQKYDMGNGFPVTTSAFDDQNKKYTEARMYGDNEEDKVEMIPFDYNAMLAKLKTPFYTNDYLRTTIQKPVEGYCAGSLTLDAAVEQIVKETELYFAERQ